MPTLQWNEHEMDEINMDTLTGISYLSNIQFIGHLSSLYGIHEGKEKNIVISSQELNDPHSSSKTDPHTTFL